MSKAFKLIEEGRQKSFGLLKKGLNSSRFWLLASPFLLLLLLDVALPFKVVPRYSTLIVASDGKILHAFLNDEDKWRLYTELEEITPVLRQTILQKEDRYFYYHPGFNPVALGRAFLNNTVTGRRSSGASTITMQVVRLLEPRQRTYLRLCSCAAVFWCCQKKAVQLKKSFSLPYINGQFIVPVLWIVFAFLTRERIVGSFSHFGNEQHQEYLFLIFVFLSFAFSVFSFLRKWSLIPVLGVLCCSYLMIEIPVNSWFVFFAWMAAGLIIYFGYGYRKSKIA